ncbi:MAG TPA: choice-of-anchor M domain-containing protein [Actinomycetaceae bacterium]|nr:choice-of-anchor M domain-containing protein [Actinomycetaceae bacterium]
MPFPRRTLPSLAALARRLAGLSAALAVTIIPAPALADIEDPNLDQTVAEDQPIVTGEHVITDGHVDLGPRYVEGQWTFLIHDDAAKADDGATSVWRFPEETVMHVLDGSILTVPDDPAYEFLGAEPGTDVWVVPQTQNPDVVWLGWNTQDPEVMAAIDRGVTIELTGLEGPGELTVYLQSGTFGEPQLLWDSRSEEPQPIWVDVNTHTHANWVFTEPGVHLVQLRVEAELLDGTTASDTQEFRLAIGSATDPQDALATEWSGGEPEAPDGNTNEQADPATTDPADTGEENSGTSASPLLIGGIGVAVLVLVAAVIGGVARQRRVRRRAFSAHADASEHGPSAGGDMQ